LQLSVKGKGKKRGRFSLLWGEKEESEKVTRENPFPVDLAEEKGKGEETKSPPLPRQKEKKR